MNVEGMLGVITQMAALILCGVAWRAIRPGGLAADDTRRVLTSVVYYLLLPALVLVVLWRTPLGLDSMRISLLAAAGIGLGIGLTWSGCRLCRSNGAVTGAMVLAASFPNATYLGLPVLQKLFGEAGRGIAIQYDLFACTPLLLTVGVLVGRHFGSGQDRGNSVWRGVLAVPPLWAAVAAVGLNLGGVPFDPWLKGWLDMLAAGVVPLMLFSLGLSLRWDTWRPAQMPALLAVSLIQLLVIPAFAWGLGSLIGLEGVMLQGAVLEAAMPSMVLGLVICDRFNLDVALYAAAVTATTALSLITLPLWYGWLL